MSLSRFFRFSSPVSNGLGPWIPGFKSRWIKVNLSIYVCKSVAFLVLAVSKTEPVSSVRVVFANDRFRLSYYYFGLPLYRLNPPDIYLARIFIPNSYFGGKYEWSLYGHRPVLEYVLSIKGSFSTEYPGYQILVQKVFEGDLSCDGIYTKLNFPLGQLKRP